MLFSSTVLADTLDNPKFYSYSGGTFTNHLIDMGFGYFRTLDNEQKEAYNQSVTHALMYAENGQTVSWYQGDASGRTVPVVTWPNGAGFCRRLHIQAIAHNTERTTSVTACYTEATDRWQWYRG